MQSLADRLLANVRDLVAHCRADAGVKAEAADFPLARLDAARMEKLAAALGRADAAASPRSAHVKNVADIYRLTALQEGLLFHSVAEPGSGLYIDQVSAELTGTFDPARFQAAWDQAVQRHAALRTAFLWDGLDEPVQVVRETVELPWTIEDWRSDDASAQARRRESRLRLDRAHGFALEQAPLLRMTLARTGERSWWWLWTFHHLIADGWSTAVLLREVFAAYAGKPRRHHRRSGLQRLHRLAGRPGPRCRRALLAGESCAASPSRRGFRRCRKRAASATPGVRQEDVQLSAETTTSIRTFAAEHGLTLNTVVQGAWALLAEPADPRRTTSSSASRHRAGRRSWRGSSGPSASSSTRCRCASPSTLRPRSPPG